MPAARPSFLRSRLFAVLAAAFVVVALLIAADPKGLRLVLALGDDVARLDTENAKLSGEVASLQKKARALEGDPSALERAARENGYVRDDELLFELR